MNHEANNGVQPVLSQSDVPGPGGSTPPPPACPEPLQGEGVPEFQPGEFPALVDAVAQGQMPTLLQVNQLIAHLLNAEQHCSRMATECDGQLATIAILCNRQGGKLTIRAEELQRLSRDTSVAVQPLPDGSMEISTRGGKPKSLIQLAREMPQVPPRRVR